MFWIQVLGEAEGPRTPVDFQPLFVTDKFSCVTPRSAGHSSNVILVQASLPTPSLRFSRAFPLWHVSYWH